MDRRTFIKQASMASGALAIVPGMNVMNLKNNKQMEQLPPYQRRMSLQNSRAMLSGGAVFSFLATSKDTNGLYTMFEAKGIPGMEPPPHTHTNEDETYYLLEGELYLKVGEKEFTAKPGDFIFLPRDVRHEFKVTSELFRCLVGIFPATLDEYFMQLSVPHNSADIPPANTTPPTAEMMEAIGKLNQKYGILM